MLGVGHPEFHPEEIGSVRRSVRLPEGVDAAAIVAGFDKGVLEIRVPKPAARKPHRVAITVGGEQPAIES
jgi:HSP20 family protein